MEVSVASFRKRYQYDKDSDLLYKDQLHEVYKARDTEEETLVALKIYTVDESSRYSLLDEVLRLKKLRHPNLVHYFETYEINTRLKDIFGNPIVNEPIRYQIGSLEFADQGTLAGLMRNKRLSEQEIKDLAGDIIDGLAYLHQNNIVQRQLNPGNILLFSQGNKVQAKIADYALSSAGIKENSVGTVPEDQIEYMSPEFFADNRNGTISAASDVWSMGVIFYEMLTGETPFGKVSAGLASNQVIQNILTKDLSADIERLPSSFKMLVKKCLVRDQTMNPGSVAALKNYLSDTVSPPEKPVNRKSSLIVEDIPSTQPPITTEKELDSPVQAVKKKRQLIVEDEVPSAGGMVSNKPSLNQKWVKRSRNKYVLGAGLGLLGVLAVVILALIFGPAFKSKSKQTSQVNNTVASTVTQNSNPSASISTPSQVNNSTAGDNNSTAGNNVSSVREPSASQKEKENVQAMHAITKTLMNDTMYAYVTMLVYYKPETSSGTVDTSAAHKSDKSLYHFWSNIFKVNCASPKNEAKVKDKIETYVKNDFQKTHELFDSYKDFRVHVFENQLNALKDQLQYRSPTKYNKNEAGNVDFNVDEEEINGALSFCK